MSFFDFDFVSLLVRFLVVFGTIWGAFWGAKVAKIISWELWGRSGGARGSIWGRRGAIWEDFCVLGWLFSGFGVVQVWVGKGFLEGLGVSLFLKTLVFRLRAGRFACAFAFIVAVLLLLLFGWFDFCWISWRYWDTLYACNLVLSFFCCSSTVSIRRMILFSRLGYPMLAYSCFLLLLSGCFSFCLHAF